VNHVGTEETKEQVTGSAHTTRDLSQLSHGLTGQYRTMASMPDTGQDADLLIRIPAH
jgi:hypothetical protein